ncbi:hypothetical protein L596_002872 [Steinernema carpocapsae]|uniref:Uncharacterized protein n=1 Tax=Steinernema carpocapsae TaxID=34508 RepID=A0A4U8UQT8_STECR|nr:hypothetical protein L596_002872 [Steinernema carpocapsae]
MSAELSAADRCNWIPHKIHKRAITPAIYKCTRLIEEREFIGPICLGMRSRVSKEIIQIKRHQSLVSML